MASTFKVGEVVEVFLNLKDPDTQLPLNPASLTLLIQRPDDTNYTLVLGVDGELENPTTGRFTYPLSLEQTGTYHWRWTATNSPTKKRVFEGSLDARTSVR
jgi:hypothetical protein